MGGRGTFRGGKASAVGVETMAVGERTGGGRRGRPDKGGWTGSYPIARGRFAGAGPKSTAAAL